MDQGIQHGVFFAISSFTVEGEKEARAPGKILINLVDIDRLVGLLKDKEMGIVTDGDDAAKIDKVYFEKFKHASGGMTLFKMKS